MHAGDMGVGDAAGEADFTAEALQGVRAGALSQVERLEGDDIPHEGVAGPVDGAHGPFAQQGLELIAAGEEFLLGSDDALSPSDEGLLGVIAHGRVCTFV
jgi:hypothetical protein